MIFTNTTGSTIGSAKTLGHLRFQTFELCSPLPSKTHWASAVDLRDSAPSFFRFAAAVVLVSEDDLIQNASKETSTFRDEILFRFDQEMVLDALQYSAQVFSSCSSVEAFVVVVPA